MHGRIGYAELSIKSRWNALTMFFALDSRSPVILQNCNRVGLDCFNEAICLPFSEFPQKTLGNAVKYGIPERIDLLHH